jgi:hypothetical protein
VLEAYQGRYRLGDPFASERSSPVMSGLPDEPFTPPVIKRLLANCGQVWLFELREGERSTYQVEVDDRQWEFSLQFAAKSKFQHEVGRQGLESKTPGIIYQTPLENAPTTDPGASESAEGGQP